MYYCHYFVLLFKARRMFRHRFQQTRMTRMLYDILTCLTTRVVMGYATFPFVLLEFMVSLLHIKTILNLMLLLFKLFKLNHLVNI